MSRFPLHHITDAEFEFLVALVCRNLLGIGITSFAKGRDGGKDAKFEGTATKFPSESSPASGKFIIQAKHTEISTASCSDYEFETTIIGKEIPKIKRQFENGEVTHYLIFTNRRKTGGAEDRIPERIKAETGVQHIWLRGLEDIERELLSNPDLAKAAGLDKLRSPMLFTPEDLRDVIVAMHDQKVAIQVAFDSEHDFRDYPGILKKNAANGLTDAYYTYIQEDSMSFFPDLEHFLKNPRNERIKEQYHAVADELKEQIIIHRDRFLSFDEVLGHIRNLFVERSVELQTSARRPLLRIILHYMYVNCDIGKKS